MNETAHVAEGHEEYHEEFSIPAVSTALIVLTVATSCAIWFQLLWGPITNVLYVLMISVLKASFVVGFFMHYRYEKPWKYALTIPACVLCVTLVCALLPDIAYESYPKGPWAPYDAIVAANHE